MAVAQEIKNIKFGSDAIKQVDNLKFCRTKFNNNKVNLLLF